MSGPAPEAERERQLRQLAGRLLTWRDPEGPATADLTLGYPDELPPELVDRTELRFLGNVVRRRAGELVGAEPMDFFAWSSWLVPSVPPAREWRGCLLVLAAFPGCRKLSLQAELVALGRRGGSGSSGYAVSLIG